MGTRGCGRGWPRRSGRSTPRPARSAGSESRTRAGQGYEILASRERERPEERNSGRSHSRLAVRLLLREVAVELLDRVLVVAGERLAGDRVRGLLHRPVDRRARLRRALAREAPAAPPPRV